MERLPAAISVETLKLWGPLIDIGPGLCQQGHFHGGCAENDVNINMSVDCTPEEARRFLGLPDVTKANELYVEQLTKAMQGVGSFEQLQEMTKSIAPMGQFGLKLFQQMMESGAAMSGMAGGSSKKD
jgi:hypothetical protein